MSQLNLREPQIREFQAKDYILHPGLKNAVEVAYALGQPLLLTGEPGTGKTKLAFKIAAMLAEQDERFLDKPLVFNTKTTSSARDLFYTYDALGHFQASNIKQRDTVVSAAQYIELQALGKAIAQTNPAQISAKVTKTELTSKQQSSVVLIDEIDKAPRDFSNDILNEIENYAFAIKEQDNFSVQKGTGQQIVVIMTSNSEKNLPDAFLRRCIFYHIPFPSKAVLFQIIEVQLGTDKKTFQYTDQALKNIIDQFELIRRKSNRKKPATAELIAWIRMLGLDGYMQKDAKGQQDLMRQNLSVLVKTQEDLSAIQDLIKAATKNDPA